MTYFEEEKEKKRTKTTIHLWFGVTFPSLYGLWVNAAKASIVTCLPGGENIARIFGDFGRESASAFGCVRLGVRVLGFGRNDHVIDKEEFRFCWQKWIKAVVRPVSALIVVDVQNDFIRVIPPINRLLNEVKFDMVVYSLDWHPEDHVSFIDNVKDRPIHHTSEISSEDAQVNDTVIFDVNNDGIPMEQRLWPRHCVQKSWGAQLHDDLKIVEDSVLVYKGTDPDTDSYSVFWDNNKKSQTSLNEELQKRNITDVYICGIAYDVCVSATTAHAIEEGYRALLIDDGCRGVCDADIQATKERTTSSNGLVIHSSQVKSLVSGRDRPPVLAYKLALEISKKMKKK
ncbi:Pyrazinamidase/nicotinamidase [Penaeus vannamei]|uniref:nicotinamidase n=1 Tax=Penaeus vannamei TaxID=6689 RepID=A0A423TXX2_PENVA|nr:Pyrazinamidase/nicotinamidase [Penaeus vannamei]